VIGEGFEEVLRAARAGEAWALEALYRDLAPGVLGYLRAQGAAEPEDLASDVFVGVVRGLPSFAGGESDLRSWVFTIAHRRLVDERRRLGRRPEQPVSPEDLPRLAGPSVGDVEEEAIRGLELARVRRVLDELSPDQRAVVLLRVLGGLSVAEAARVLGKREGAVKMLQRRGFARLARSLSVERVRS
jgi:RNA polymerase sigma factor (sigma-70 family)